MTFRNRPKVNTPLGDLIAGRIDQAEYRRRMAELERHAADSLDVEPAPARRRPEPAPGRRRPEPDRSGTVIVWLAVCLGVVLLAIAIAGLVVHLAAAPRSAPGSTPSVDVSGRWSTEGLTGAPSRSSAPSAGAVPGQSPLDVGGAPLLSTKEDGS